MRMGMSCFAGSLSVATCSLFSKLPPCLFGIEACASSHHWSRQCFRDLRRPCPVLTTRKNMSASGPARLRCGEFSHGSVKRTHKGPLRDALARNIPRARRARAEPGGARPTECEITGPCLGDVDDRSGPGPLTRGQSADHRRRAITIPIKPLTAIAGRSRETAIVRRIKNGCVEAYSLSSTTIESPSSV
jgi:hypothetical protein